MVSRFLRFWWIAAISPVWAEKAVLAADGRAAMPVVISASATDETKAVAERLADLLGRISGGKFEVQTGDGSAGIVMGLATDFTAMDTGVNAKEEYLLRSAPERLQIIGATPMALEDASWDLLYRLGYRQFFPGATWEIVPAEKNLAIDVDVKEKPAYVSRRIWYGFGGWPSAKEPYRDWCAKNRVREGFDLNTGHAYEALIKRHEQDFKDHPEYLALVGGVRKGQKLCISNPGLRGLVVADALKRCADDPNGQSISMDPSDGGGWCECAECAKIGSITDQALTLANEVAEEINKKYPGRFVGMYAYSFHSPPPNIRVHPQIVISIATAFIRGGATLDELIESWHDKGAKLGIREYYSVNTWDRDLPGAARGGNPEYLARTIPEFINKGAMFLSAESSDNWAPNGLGYYLASRMLWNPKEAADVGALTEDFLTKSFGAAKEPMREFYGQLDGSKSHLVAKDQLGRMFRALGEAVKSNEDASVRARIDALTLYAKYVDLYQTYAKAEGTDRQATFETLIRHAYRMKDTSMIHSQALYRDLASRDKSVKIPSEAAFKVPEGKNPWKSNVDFTAAELAKFIEEGIASNPLSELKFEPLKFSENLGSAAPLNLPDVPSGNLGPARGKQTFYTTFGQQGGEIELKVTGGLIAHYRDRGLVKLELWKIGGESETGEKETLVAEDRSVPPDGEPHAVKLAVKSAGLYRLDATDGSDRTLIELLSSIPWTVESSYESTMNKNYSGPWLQYFYVPKGTSEIGFFGGEHGEIRDPAERPLFWLNGREPNFYSVSVPAGEDGKLWSIRNGRGAVKLLTVPPYFADTAAKLLLPVEVIAKDRKE